MSSIITSKCSFPKYANSSRAGYAGRRYCGCRYGRSSILVNCRSRYKVGKSSHCYATRPCFNAWSNSYQYRRTSRWL